MGGMETYSYQVAQALSGRLDLTLYKLPGNSNGSSPSVLKVIAFGLTTAIRSLTNNKNNDVIHGFDISVWPLVYIAAWSGKAKIVALSAHGTDVSYAFRSSISGRLYGAYCRVGARLLPHTKILANSAVTADLCRKIGFHDTEIIPLAALPNQNEPGAVSLTNKILFLGRLKSRKGCGWFIKNILPNLSNDIRVAIAGRSDDPEEDWVINHSRVDYLGVLDPDDLILECASAICVVVPNRNFGIESFEGFGLVAPEAAAAGGVVLASDVFGLKEAVCHGTTGFLLNPDDTQDWLDKINEIRNWSTEERNRFVAKSKAYAQRLYSWERVARQTIESHERSLSQHETRVL